MITALRLCAGVETALRHEDDVLAGPATTLCVLRNVNICARRARPPLEHSSVFPASDKYVSKGSKHTMHANKVKDRKDREKRRAGPGLLAAVAPKSPSRRVFPPPKTHSIHP
ncbi:hypothetical protein PMIN06_003089 [Paraphaeosphaeria minitans]